MAKKTVILKMTLISFLFVTQFILAWTLLASAAITLWQVTPAESVFFNEANCNIISQTLCPAELGWKGNTVYYAFNLPSDQALPQKLALEFNVYFRNYNNSTNVVLQISAGKTKTSLTIVNPALEINDLGKFTVLIDSNLFQKGAINYIKVYGTNVTPIGYGTNPPNFKISYIMLNTYGTAMDPVPVLTDDELLDKTEAQAANYFYDHALKNGLVKDTLFTNYASIAATGFGLTAFPIMAKRYGTSPEWKYTPEQLRARANKILDSLTVIQDAQSAEGNSYGKSGLFFHFITESNSNATGSEVSTVDSAILFAGAITAGEYFGGEVKTKAGALVSKADWNYFLRSPSNTFNTNNGIEYQFTHGWMPSSGIISQTWDRPSDETLLISIIALASNPANVNFQKSFFSWPREKKNYAGFEVIYSYFGSLFTYEFAHAWVDFSAIGVDNPVGILDGVTSADWWQNSINAAKAARQFAIDNKATYSSYGDDSWGLSAVQKPDGTYEGEYGAEPMEANNGNAVHDGTIAPYSSISAIPFFKNEDGGILNNNKAFRVLRNLYDTYYWNLWGSYGPKESFNHNNEFSSAYLGIDVGVTAAMIENYRSNFIWNQFLKNTSVKCALKKIFVCENAVCGIKGDINDDCLIDLRDVILVLQLITNRATLQSVPDNSGVNADVNGDSRIGLPEVIYILQKEAGLASTEDMILNSNYKTHQMNW